MQLRDLPLFYAAQRFGGCWRLLAPNNDPFLPSVIVAHVVEELEESEYTESKSRWNRDVTRPFPTAQPSHIRSWRQDAQLRQPQTRAEITWPRERLLEVASLLDRLSPPDFRNPSLYFEQRSAIVHELRRLARWRPSA